MISQNFTDSRRRSGPDFTFLTARIASNRTHRYNLRSRGQLAQLVEQRIENPRVRGSIPRLATKKIKQKPGQLARAFAFLTLRLPSLNLRGKLLDKSGCDLARYRWKAWPRATD